MDAVPKELPVSVPDAEPFDMHMALGRACRSHDDWEGAAEQFAAACRLRPEAAAAHLDWAEALRRLERISEARDVLRAVLAHEPHNVPAWVGLGLLARRRGEHGAAAAYFQHAQAAQDSQSARSQDPEIELALASSLRDADLAPRAETVYRRILATHPRCAEAWAGCALIERDRGNHAASLEAWDAALAVAPDEVGYLNECGSTLAVLGRLEDADAVYQRSLAVTRSAAALQGLGLIALARGQYESALDWGTQALELEPRRASAYRQNCRALLQLGRPDDAVEVVGRLESGAGDRGEADSVRLEILRLSGRRPEALAVLARTHRAQPAGFALWFETVLTRLTFFDLPGAKATLQDCPAGSPDERSRVMYAQGLLADLEWRIEDAIDWFGRALDNHPDNSSARAHLARLSVLNWYPAGAKQHLHGLQLNGIENDESPELLAQLIEELRQDRDVHARLRSLQRMSPPVRLRGLAELVRAAPKLTPPAIAYLVALRQAGRLSSPAGQSAQRAWRIPRNIMQYWDEGDPPERIDRPMRSWESAHPDHTYRRFDRAAAIDYLSTRQAPEILRAFGRAQHPKDAATLFRLAYLATEGGYSIGADEQCVGPLDALATPGAVFFGHQEQHGLLSTRFIGCTAGDAVIERALSLAIDDLLTDDEPIRLSSGSCLLSRAFAQTLAAQGEDWRAWLERRCILDRNELSRVSWNFQADDPCHPGIGLRHASQLDA